ncbi:MAG: molybdenum cofactor guanylyltransferase MobA [Methylobacter sp.]|nr:molybdenum cofactor guanylyltransferase MobA [Methylobacter sp.]
MNSQTKVAGVILAGGRARRMNNQDKGLVRFKGQAMVSYAIAALAPVVDSVFINANRNLEHYRQLGYPVISDQTDSFDGPLAGILAAMVHSDADILLVLPCDSPLIQTRHVQKLLAAYTANNADAAVAFDGARSHPVFLAIKRSLQDSLQAYLSSGQRKVGTWLAQHNPLQVDFSDEPEILNNVNTLNELSILEDTHYLG